MSYEISRIQKVIEGLQILATLKGADVCAEHDIIYAGGYVETEEDEEDDDDADEEEDEDDRDGPEPRDTRLTVEQQARLEQLGWFVDRESDSWAHFV